MIFTALALGTLAMPQSGVTPALQEQINQAVDQGVVFLLNRQLPDGSWESWSDSYAGGLTPVCLYALLKSGVPAEHPAILRGLAHLQVREPAHTYNTGFLLLALAATRNKAYAGWAEDLAATLGEWQQSSGLWAYPNRHEDLSNSLVAVLALDAAVVFGIEMSSKFWKRTLAGVERCQSPTESVEQKDGKKIRIQGFGYRPGAAASGSMVAAGITISQICRKHLGSKMSSRNAKIWDKHLISGLAWLNERWNLGKNPPDRAWHFFHLWGLERVGARMDTETIGKHRWYLEGAQWLLKDQKPDGNWYWVMNPSKYDLGRDRMCELNTCMALLFLNRASVAVTTGAGDPLPPRTTDEDAELVLKSFGDTPMTIWVAKSDLPGSSARFFFRFAGFNKWNLLAEDADPAQGFATQHSFERPGRWELRCELETEGGVLKSPILAVTVSLVHPKGALQAASDSERNLLLPLRKEYSASSFLDKRWSNKAFDGLLGVAWYSKANDAHPWVEVKIRERLRGNRILLTHANNRIAGALPHRAKKVRLTINGRDSYEFEMAQEPWQKTTFELPKKTLIRTLRVEILSLQKGDLSKESVGIAEIEVQA